MYKAIHVYDLDGVLVDTSHRYRNKEDGTIDLEYWFANRTKENIERDTLLPMAKQYQRDCINENIYTVICTSRMYHVWDIEFIVSQLGVPDKLIMRPEGDMTADGELKRRQLQRLFNLRQFRKLPKLFFEDNIKNILATEGLWTRAFLIPSNICEVR